MPSKKNYYYEHSIEAYIIKRHFYPHFNLFDTYWESGGSIRIVHWCSLVEHIRFSNDHRKRCISVVIFLLAISSDIFFFNFKHEGWKSIQWNALHTYINRIIVSRSINVQIIINSGKFHEFFYVWGKIIKYDYC